MCLLKWNIFCVYANPHNRFMRVLRTLTPLFFVIPLPLGVVYRLEQE